MTYAITNTRDEAIRAVVRRPVRAEWTLEPEPQGLLKAAGAYYIPIDVPAGETIELKLREVTPVRRSLTLDSTLAMELLKIHLTEEALDPALKAAIDEVIAKRSALTDIQEELSDLRASKNELSNEAYRIASSLSDIKDIKERTAKKLREQLLRRASELEKQIGKKSTRIAELSLQESDVERTLRALFRSVTFDRAAKVEQ